MRIVKARLIDYNSATDLIEVRSPWFDRFTVRRIAQAITDGVEHELHAVLGWGDATHRLMFLGHTWGVLDENYDPIGWDFLVKVEEEPSDEALTRRRGETVGQWTARMLGESRDV